MVNYGSMLITGANRGLGLEFVRQYLRFKPKPSHIIAVVQHSSNTEVKFQQICAFKLCHISYMISGAI